MRITLVRHGETTGLSSIRYYGKTDVPLSEQGRSQMRRAAAALAGHDFDHVFSSNLSRSREGAALVAGATRRVTPVASFDEIDFGDWEGWTHEEIAARDPERYHHWRARPASFHFPGGESRSDFEVRVAQGLREVLRESRDRILMVLHRGVIAVILTELLRLSDEQRHDLGIDLASIHVVARRDEGWCAERLDWVEHLRSHPVPPLPA